MRFEYRAGGDIRDSFAGSRDSVESLKYPQDKDIIFHLGKSDLKRWIYSQPPQVLWSLDYAYNIGKKIEKKLKCGKIESFLDLIWRIFH